jgi:hypothetical protein
MLTSEPSSSPWSDVAGTPVMEAVCPAIPPADEAAEDAKNLLGC